MKKEQLDKELSEIEVPKEDVFRSISQGIEKGKKEQMPKRKSKKKFWGVVSAAAATGFLASGLIFAPVTNVLASVPGIGSIYQKFSLQIGHELLGSDLITEMNQTASSNGVDVTLTSAYYDGNVIGITFKTEGGRISDDYNEEGPEIGYNFHLFDGVEQNQWAASMTSLEKTGEDEYVAAMEFFNPDDVLAENLTLPLTFTQITGVKGDWKFDVPVSQIPSETIYSDAESVFDGGNYSFRMESVTKGKATTLLNYQTTFPLDGEGDNIQITVFDNEGNRLSKSSANVLSVLEKDNGFEKDVRELFASKIPEDAKYLVVHPEIRMWEHETVSALEHSGPFVIESGRFDFELKVNQVEQNEDQLVLDFNVQNLEQGSLHQDLIDNFAEFIMPIRSEHLYRLKDGELDMNNIIGHQIRNEKLTLIDEKTNHYQSVFTIENADEFDAGDYSLMVPFGSLSRNQPVEMEKIRVDLVEE
ncbi:DUF4179 domain-containing protein [Jeotgalibacillus campisalis]|uniref:DUF4179 domain-containing protein n=1 Tax=Jeotgalibacillus campisalis TaxID=220754 RepID=A0A0C2SFP5_9BACL|nr:DUF4179 domain-containing protein [Jeotgalibacillus campisalis]KIL52749.1 hypothetical protein KR50_00780 [Jeotgalibacillus campisalis]